MVYYARDLILYSLYYTYLGFGLENINDKRRNYNLKKQKRLKKKKKKRFNRTQNILLRRKSTIKNEYTIYIYIYY